MAKETTTGGFRLVLGDRLEGKLADFCAAHYDATKTSVIQHALENFIEGRLADPEETAMRKRYEDARKARLTRSGLGSSD